MTSVSASGGRSPVRLCRIVPQTNDPPAWLKAGRAFSFLATSVSAAITKAASDPRALKLPTCRPTLIDLIERRPLAHLPCQPVHLPDLFLGTVNEYLLRAPAVTGGLECPCCRQACWGFSFLSALVNLASMRNIDHENDEPAVIDVAQDSVVTDPVSPHA